MDVDINDEKEQREKFSMRQTRSSSKLNHKNNKKDVDGIRMATDIWAEQYQYEGGEIKWPVIKRIGWFMAIPRLKLPKGNKYRYSHKERKAKQEILDREKKKEIDKK